MNVHEPEDTSGSRGRCMAAEIHEQPAVLGRVLAEAREMVYPVAVAAAGRGPRFVLLAARGTSDHAALYAKYLIEIVLGLPAGLASPSTLTAYGAGPRMDEVLWIVISQSGSSSDLVDSTRVARSRGAMTLAVTNDVDSPVAGLAEFHMDMLAGQERAVAATKTYTASLLTLWLFIEYWRGGDGRAARSLPTVAADVLAGAAIEPVLERYRAVDTLIITARGYAYATARESALKLMETSYLSAHAFSGADLLHGPLAMIEEDRPVLAVLAGGIGSHTMLPVLDALKQRGANLCVVGDSSAVTGAVTGTDCVLSLPSGIDEQLSPIVQIMPLQMLSHALALARGHDPDVPRGLHKVTSTW